MKKYNPASHPNYFRLRPCTTDNTNFAAAALKDSRKTYCATCTANNFQPKERSPATLQRHWRFHVTTLDLLLANCYWNKKTIHKQHFISEHETIQKNSSRYPENFSGLLPVSERIHGLHRNEYQSYVRANIIDTYQMTIVTCMLTSWGHGSFKRLDDSAAKNSNCAWTGILLDRP